jgi:5-methylcytosine-specific restriction endonuclease McrA
MGNEKTNPEAIRLELKSLVENFAVELKKQNLRSKVLALVEVLKKVRELGKSLIPLGTRAGAREHILLYFKKYPYTIIEGDELLVVSGIQEYARRIRELKVEYGWAIISGDAAKEMAREGDFPLPNIDVTDMKPTHYILISETQDTEAAYRWNVAHDIRKRKDGVRAKLLEYLKHNEGKPVTGEELRYVARGATEWARRIRELRTEQGWQITTKNTGRPDLPVGTYVLESSRQSPEHDRNISDSVRGAVFRRDDYACTICGWKHADWNRSDPRHLELHHKKEHARGGENTEENLVTLCTVCHDRVHAEQNEKKRKRSS